MTSRITGLALVAIILAGCNDDPVTSSSYRFQAEQNFDLTQDLAGELTFRLQGISGNIEITADPAVQSVRASGTRLVESNDSQGDADDRLEHLQVVLSTDGDEIFLRTLQPSTTQGRNYTVNYTIVVPTGIDIETESINGNVTVEDADQSLEVGNVNGNVTITRCIGEIALGNGNGNLVATDVQGRLTAMLINGNIEADMVVAPGKQAILTTVNGNVRLTVPVLTSADVSLALVNGQITVSGLTLADRVETATTLTGRLGAGDGTIELRTSNGNLVLAGG